MRPPKLRYICIIFGAIFAYIASITTPLNIKRKMDDTNPIKRHTAIKNMIDGCRINEAIDSIGSDITSNRQNVLSEKLTHVRETYRYLVHYMLEGITDSSRESVLSDLREQLHVLNDRLLRSALAKESPEYYYATLRFNEFKNLHVSELLDQYGKVISELSLAEAAGGDSSQLKKESEELLERLFNSVYTSLGDDGEYRDLYSYLMSGYADRAVAAESLSALTLSLLHFYDKGKLAVLLDVYENTDDDFLAARALTGVIFSLMFYPERINSDRKLIARLQLWNDSLDTYRRLRETIRVLVGTRDTKRIADKMKDEVLPELMKLRPEMLKSLREGLTETGFGVGENNPEWEEMLEKSGINEKMRELSEMQGEGADLMMVTFSNLKQFPFFNSASNWFLPFDINHTGLQLSDELKKFIGVLVDAGNNVCDSDLYSLALAVVRMPESQRNMISSQLTAQFEQLQEELKSKVPTSTTPKFDNEVLKAIRDLYRFFKLFRNRAGFKDPFEKPVNLAEMPVIGEMMQNDEMLRLIGEFYFNRGYYEEALPIFRLLSSSNPEDATLWEKSGFCHQKAGDLQTAGDNYSKAALLKTPGPWLVKKLAYVNRRLGNYGEAAEYFNRALEMEPDNVSLIMSLGSTLLESGEVSGALQQFYHANYLSPDNFKIIRSLAWLEMLNGNLGKSAEYHNKIINAEPKSSDYLNAGHTQLLLGNFKEALNYYRLSSRDGKEEFRKVYLEDLATLTSLGLDRTTALIMLDNV